MHLLAVETSTEACSAALLIDGAISERFEIAPRRHTALILPMLDELLAGAGLTLAAIDALAFGRGPGAFTGVRIAAGVVQGIAFARDLPVVPVSTLAALAQGVLTDSGETLVLAALDARISEVYWGAYRAGDNGIMQAAGEEIVCAPQEVPLPGAGRWYGAGSGFGAYETILATRLEGILSGLDTARCPRARDVARIGADAFARGEALAAEQALPVYLRDRVAEKPARR